MVKKFFAVNFKLRGNYGFFCDGGCPGSPFVRKYDHRLLPSQPGRGQAFKGFGLRESPSPKGFSEPEKDGGISVGFLKDEIFRGGPNDHRV
jgi:hypothetical protein